VYSQRVGKVEGFNLSPPIQNPSEQRNMTHTQIVDALLCNASESQLRNVLAMASQSIPDKEMIAFFRNEVRMTATEAFDEEIQTAIDEERDELIVRCKERGLSFDEALAVVGKQFRREAPAEVFAS
jgi:hypothetical protein